MSPNESYKDWLDSQPEDFDEADWRDDGLEEEWLAAWRPATDAEARELMEELRVSEGRE